MTFNPKNAMFVVKYQPDKLSDVIGDHKIKIMEYLKDPSSVPHFLFYGTTPGVGKSLSMKLIIKELGADYMILNSSDDRKIESIREKVKEFAMTASSKPGLRKIIGLDEADGMCLPFGTEIFCGNNELNNHENRIRKIEDLHPNKWYTIPSVNLKTGKIESDKGKLVDSGYADFFEIELEDGRKIIASGNHPFFKEGLIETKLKDLEEGDLIIDYSDEIYKECPICGKRIFKNTVTCSMDCKNKLHSQRQSGEGNSRYGAILSEETRQKMSKALKGHPEPEWKRKQHSEWMKKNWSIYRNEEYYKKLSRSLKGRKKSPEHIEKHRQAISLGVGTEKYENIKNKKNEPLSFIHQVKKRRNKGKCKCELCEKEILGTGGKKETQSVCHHIDRNKRNNSNENIIVICPSCHFRLHNSYRCDYKKEYLQKNKNNLLKWNIIFYNYNIKDDKPKRVGELI